MLVIAASLVQRVREGENKGRGRREEVCRPNSTEDVADKLACHLGSSSNLI